MTEKDLCLSDDERLDYINEDLSLIQLKRGLTFGTDAYLLSAFVKECSGHGADLGSAAVQMLPCTELGAVRPAEFLFLQATTRIEIFCL